MQLFNICFTSFLESLAKEVYFCVNVFKHELGPEAVDARLNDVENTQVVLGQRQLCADHLRGKVRQHFP